MARVPRRRQLVGVVHALLGVFVVQVSAGWSRGADQVLDRITTSFYQLLYLDSVDSKTVFYKTTYFNFTNKWCLCEFKTPQFVVLIPCTSFCQCFHTWFSWPDNTFLNKMTKRIIALVRIHFYSKCNNLFVFISRLYRTEDEIFVAGARKAIF